MDNKAMEFSKYRLERAKETLKTAKVCCIWGKNTNSNKNC